MIAVIGDSSYEIEDKASNKALELKIYHPRQSVGSSSQKKKNLQTLYNTQKNQHSSEKPESLDHLSRLYSHFDVSTPVAECWEASDGAFCDDVSSDDVYQAQDQSIFFIFELGQLPLSKFLSEQNWRPSWTEVLNLGYSLGKALEYIHSLTLAHTDIQPDNVVSFPGGRWKLCACERVVLDGSPCERPEISPYSAPEQAAALLDDEPVLATSSTDTWAFGKMLYEMVCGDRDVLLGPVDLLSKREIADKVVALRAQEGDAACSFRSAWHAASHRSTAFSHAAKAHRENFHAHEACVNQHPPTPTGFEATALGLGGSHRP